VIARGARPRRLLVEERELALVDAAHQDDAPAGAVGLVAGLAVGGAGLEAEPAVDAGHEALFEVFPVHRCPLSYHRSPPVRRPKAGFVVGLYQQK
jgi:hypothetical protein